MKEKSLPTDTFNGRSHSHVDLRALTRGNSPIIIPVFSSIWLNCRTPTVESQLLMELLDSR